LPGSLHERLSVQVQFGRAAARRCCPGWWPAGKSRGA